MNVFFKNGTLYKPLDNYGYTDGSRRNFVQCIECYVNNDRVYLKEGPLLILDATDCPAIKTKVCIATI